LFDKNVAPELFCGDFFDLLWVVEAGAEVCEAFKDFYAAFDYGFCVSLFFIQSSYSMILWLAVDGSFLRRFSHSSHLHRSLVLFAYASLIANTHATQQNA
jgi:hypothetical protein